MAYELLRVEERDAAVVITLDRPPVNALNLAILGELGHVVSGLAGRRDVRGVVLPGEGRAFVAGADIAEMASYSPAQAVEFAGRGQAVLRSFEDLPMPTLAAVNGFALGGGCELAMCADLILAGPQALFGQPEVKLGVLPGFGGTQRLRRRVGDQRARELIYTGRNVEADEAVSLGLALGVHDDVVSAAVQLAGRIARNGPHAVSLAKRAMAETACLGLDAGLAHEATLFGLCFAHPEQGEGMAAFLEKRKPTFGDR